LRADDLRVEDFRVEDFRVEDFRADDLRVGDFRADDLRLDVFFGGTLPPARRASDRPIAIACLRLFTFLPERPLFNVPLLRSCIAFLTLLFALLPYFAMSISLPVTITMIVGARSQRELSAKC